MTEVQISKSPLSGELTVPPSKSSAHRAIICAALARGVSVISPVVLSNDMKATISAVEALGVKTVLEGTVLTVDSSAVFSVENAVINCGESGSTLRFLIPVAACGGTVCTFTGEGRLPRRPIGAFLELLPAHGTQCVSDGGLPLSISGKLSGGTFEIRGDESSQYITGLLLGLVLTGRDSAIILTTPLESRGYVDMTVQVMKQFGVRVEERENGYFIAGGQRFTPARFHVEGDWSQAGYFMAAGALGGSMRLLGLDIYSTQRDMEAARILKEMGADIRFENDILYAAPGMLKGVDIDASQIPDAVPALAVACAFAEGESRIYGAARLRIKESDRIESVAAGLEAIGVKVRQTDDGMIIQGGGLHPGRIRGFNDHRIVMAFSVAAAYLRGESVIEDAQSVAKSFPDFFEEFNRVGGKASVVSLGS